MAPSEGKKNSRRLLSFDTLSNRTASNASEQSHGRPLPSRLPTLSQSIDDEKTTVAEASKSPQTWTGVDLVESPRKNDDDKGSLRSASPVPESRRKPAPLRSTRPTTPEAPQGPSVPRARWDRLRQHVIPIPIRPATPPPSTPAATAQALPPRSQTPKPSRLARLGFRQIVDHARELDGNQRFAQELEKVCWSIRLTEPHKVPVKVDATPAGSALHLAFMSSTSLASTGTSSTQNHSQSNKKPELRRPQSIQALSMTGRSVPSVTTLYQTLLQYATPSGDARALSSSLPRESLVLSTLLLPFLTSEHGTQWDEERWSAIEAFEVITRSWAPLNEGMGVERYLWCCKAAFVPPSSMRTRILSVLWGLLIPTETNYTVTTPECFQTLAQGGTASSEEYDTVASAKDDRGQLRAAIMLEALSRCLEDCSDDSRIWLFQNVLEQYWIKSPNEVKFTRLLRAIHARTLLGLSRALLSVLSVPLDQGAAIYRAQCIARILQERFIPDIDALGDVVKSEAMINVINAVLELIHMDRAKEPTRWGVSLVKEWYREPSMWKTCLDKTLQDFISKGNWSNIVVKLGSLIRLLPDEIRKQMVAFVVPHLYDKLVDQPPPYPCVPLTNLLDTIARLHPQVFYKPLFLCAATSKEFTVVNHLCVIVIVSKFLPDYWIRDAEMMSVALMSDGGRRVDASDSANGTWMKARLGQAVVMLELIGCLQAARHLKQSASNADALVGETAKFAAALELRLAILLEARERTASTPPSQRLLFCILFREMRLLTRSLKPASWLVRIVSWYIDIVEDDGIGQDPEEEEKSTIGQIQGLYAAAQDGVRSAHQRRSTMVLSKSLQTPQIANDAASAGNSADLAAIFAQKETLLKSLSKGFVPKAMKLLVTMSTLLTADEYQRLAPFLWYQLQSNGDTSLTSAVCFLIMQSAEKTPMDLVARIEVDLQSSDHETKLNAVYKIGILFNWRYQILPQHVVADRARRPFKVTRGPLAFVATDIGSSSYIREDDADELKDSLPAELRKHLAEIGWDQDDAPLDQHREWVKTPISLLSTQQIDRLDNLGPDLAIPSSPSALSSGPLSTSQGEKVDEVGLLRRNSSSGGPQPAVKRRAVFVPSLALVFPRLASLVFDSDLAISSAARHTVVDIMRNDPNLLSRPVLDLFAGEQKDMQAAVVTFNAFLHVQRLLPYPMTHLMFNNVAGFLKWATKQSEEADALLDFAQILPILSRLLPQVSGVSIRDIRRAKIEPYLIPSGSLWFPSSAPSGPMFPRSFGSQNNPFDNLPSDLVSITMIRVSQNMLFLSMLKRNRQDVQLVRKNLSRLELPATTPSKRAALELSDFVPRRRQKQDSNPGLTGLSLMLSRSHLLLVAQIFRCMSRHLNDRNELAVLVDGLNQILLAHGDDIGIVSQVLIALMVASTRFRRLFTSGGGYALFMPAVLKAYTESQSHSGIKLAIEYAVNRFYALHQEAFVFQTLDILAHVTALPNIEAEWLVKSIYNLFFSLRQGILPSTPDAAGIHNANKLQEREALIVSTAEDTPQTFLTVLRRGDSTEHDRVKIDLPEEYTSSRLGIDNFVRLFLTVIAHDPTIVRAEQFLRLLRIMAPHLYHASSKARTVLQEGIDALASVLLRTSAKPKAHDATSNEGVSSLSSDALLENRLLEKSRTASSIVTMRLDYLALIIAFTRAGGLLTQPAMLRAMELIKTMLKEIPVDMNRGISTFFTDFIQTSFLRESPPSYKMIVTFFQELAPLITNHGPVVDFSGAYHAVSELLNNAAYSNEPAFSRAVVAHICGPGLASCEAAAAADVLLSLPSRLSIVNLSAKALLLRGADVIAEVEKRTPSYDFLAGVVLPLVISMKTEALLDQSAEPWQRKAVGGAWVRLLQFVLSACKPRRALERSRSQDKHRTGDPKRSQLPAFCMSLQIIKVIVVRAEPELSSRLPGIWPRLSAFLIKALAGGSANFVTNAHAPDISPSPSPSHSPRSSAQLDPFQSSISAKFTLAISPQVRTFSSPRIIDYSLWSFLELLCVYRSPLVLQMRLFTVEKLVELHHSLGRHRRVYSPNDTHSRRASSSVFAKPRRRLSGTPSPASPGASPRLSASQTFPQGPSFASLEVGRQPGYNIMSSPHETRGPKIVHLGPISAMSAFGRALSPGRGGKGDPMGTTTTIKSMNLIRATYRRIRTVQRCMGYSDVLLPMPESQEMDADEAFTTTWTRQEALNAISKETQELLEEFEETDRTLEDEGVLVEAPPSPRHV
ncbi:putative ion transmembrane transport [Lyophyllum shimeji]|uniref:Ion transmembrane transport n=1 Tax=Lyophyllum shimeji TaxID=47721 RepID=A0A9P3UTL5_LYOSH|nr:putative ion transmembrane transport [Lyophyllum shimeji]